VGRIDPALTTYDAKKGGIDIDFSPTFYSTEKNITAALNLIRTLPELKPHFEEWQIEREKSARQLVTIPLPGRDGAVEVLTKPQSKNGTIVCGPVNSSLKYNKKLKNLDRKILAIETEAGGVFEVANSHGVPVLSIRGISDFADNGKKELEEKSGGAVRKVAASNAATFLKLQLKNSRFLDILKQRRELTDASKTFEFNFAPVPANDVSKVLQTLNEQIEQRLRELCPEFRLLPKGYHLPIPRVRMVNQQSGVGEYSVAPPVNVRDVVAESRMSFLNLPRTYPDQSLPWVIADDLLTVEIEGKQILPIVLNAELVRPPKSDFESVSELPINQYCDLLGTQIVFIIENIPFSSKSRLNFLIGQINAYTNARFLLIDRSDVNLLIESEFVASLSAKIYDVCEISFGEIAHFIQKNFEMSGSEAEVIALRLRDTFTRFDLSAHPSYFAGIPRETLSALLQANRRAELIQLAVDGFLTFLVADDRADITLSRTTRSRFLKRLAVALRVEKESFDEAKLVAFTMEFANEHDFEIDPIAFIQSFVEKGLIYFDLNEVRISLPFIESYILASELNVREDLAVRYFQVDDPDFDLATFDLYAEIGASPKIVGEVQAQIELSIEVLERRSAGRHILLTNEILPSSLRDSGRIRALQTRLRNAIDDIQSSQDSKDEKQRLLDLADEIKSRTAKQYRDKIDDDSRETAESEERLEASLRAWAIGVILLGSGAEHLTANTKRRIAAYLIKITSLIWDEWTRYVGGTDIEQIKSELLS
jgi:hypothetical protein